MEPLEHEREYICCGCGKRIPMLQNPPITTATTKQGEGGVAGGIKVAGSLPPTTGGSGREKKIAFVQPEPKHQSAKDWFKRKHDPKSKFDADDIALLNRGAAITHTFEIKRKPDTLPNPTENRKQTSVNING
jgi:hypothetical protein